MYVMHRHLELERLQPPPGRGPWYPFGIRREDHDGFNLHWWHKPVWHGAHNRRFFALTDRGGRHVARLHLDLDAPIDLYLTATPVRPVLEVQFIEVHIAFRGQGIGPDIVNRVQRENPGHQLMALSTDADGFWEGLGWARHRHKDDDGATARYQSMFLGP